MNISMCADRLPVQNVNLLLLFECLVLHCHLTTDHTCIFAVPFPNQFLSVENVDQPTPTKAIEVKKILI